MKMMGNPDISRLRILKSVKDNFGNSKIILMRKMMITLERFENRYD